MVGRSEVNGIRRVRNIYSWGVKDADDTDGKEQRMTCASLFGGVNDDSIEISNSNVVGFLAPTFAGI